MLFSVFVMAIGMLSVATLIPVGKTLLTRGAAADRSSAGGTAALSEISLRGIDDPVMWDPRGAPTDEILFEYGYPLVIDPLFIAANPGDLNADYFPYPRPPGGVPEPYAVAPATPFPSPPAAGRIRRLSVLSVRPNPAIIPDDIAFPLAQRIFTFEDDAEFTLPDSDERPGRVYNAGPDGLWGVPDFDDDGNGVDDDASEAGMGGDDIPQFAGKYSWLVTIVPALSEITPLVAPIDRKLYTASVVVLADRRLAPPVAGQPTPPAERMVWCTFEFGVNAYGGGNVALRLDDAGEDYFKLSVNQWIMVAGQYTDGASPPTFTTPVYRWYRIAGLGDPKNDTGNDNADYRDVTLAGPDIVAPTGLVIDDLDPDLDHIQWVAYILDGAVGVFEKTIEVDHPSIWTH